MNKARKTTFQERITIVKDCLENGSIHPTEEQIDRLQTLYPKGRKALKCIAAKPNRNGRVIKGWYFDKEDDIKAWSASAGIENLKVENGLLTGDIIDSDRYLSLIVPMVLDCRAVCYIRTRIKHEEIESEWVTERTLNECYLLTYSKKSWKNVDYFLNRS